LVQLALVVHPWHSAAGAPSAETTPVGDPSGVVLAPASAFESRKPLFAPPQPAQATAEVSASAPNSAHDRVTGLFELNCMYEPPGLSTPPCSDVRLAAG
jgi:hypothetical protein